MEEALTIRRGSYEEPLRNIARDTRPFQVLRALILKVERGEKPEFCEADYEELCRVYPRRSLPGGHAGVDDARIDRLRGGTGQSEASSPADRDNIQRDFMEGGLCDDNEELTGIHFERARQSRLKTQMSTLRKKLKDTMLGRKDSLFEYVGSDRYRALFEMRAVLYVVDKPSDIQ